VSARLIALAMIVLAAVLHFAVARPLRAQAAADADAFGAARVARRDATSRLAALQRRNQARSRAVAAVQGAADDPAATTRAVRSSVAQAVEGARAKDVHLAIRPGRTGVDVTVTAHGSMDEVLDLTAALARPDSGVVLDRAFFQRADRDITLSVQGLGIAGTR
jgi:hypothetical protein